MPSWDPQKLALIKRESYIVLSHLHGGTEFRAALDKSSIPPRCVSSSDGAKGSFVSSFDVGSLACVGPAMGRVSGNSSLPGCPLCLSRGSSELCLFKVSAFWTFCLIQHSYKWRMRRWE